MGSCRVELRAEATGLQPAYHVPWLKLPIELACPEGFEPSTYGFGDRYVTTTPRTYGGPSRVRTEDRGLKRPLLLPTELRVQCLGRSVIGSCRNRSPGLIGFLHRNLCGSGWDRTTPSFEARLYRPFVGTTDFPSPCWIGQGSRIRTCARSFQSPATPTYHIP